MFNSLCIIVILWNEHVILLWDYTQGKLKEEMGLDGWLAKQFDSICFCKSRIFHKNQTKAENYAAGGPRS